MNHDRFGRLSEEENDKKESMLEIVIGICLGNKNKKPQRIHEKILEAIQKNQSSNMLKKIKKR